MVKIKASRSNDSFEGKSAGHSRKNSGNPRRKSGAKASKHKHNKSVAEKVEDDDMDKIIHDLKYFKEHMQAAKRAPKNNNRAANKDPGGSAPKKGKESVGESGENTTAASQQASRPRTSRGNRPKSKVERREANGGNSAMGFHSNKPQQLFYKNIANSQGIHHRSVNEGLDSPGTKKRKHNKGRISPSPFIGHHQRQPSAVIKSNKLKRNTSTSNEKNGFARKNRPQSANLKKKGRKSADRLKKKDLTAQRMHEMQNSFKPHINNKLFNYSKGGVVTKNISKNLIQNEENSFDQEGALRHKLFKKNLGIAKKGEVKIKMAPNKAIISKKSGNKFVMYSKFHT